ncbi:multidrug transporter subunit MdtI [Aliidiomarina taiwanensis]|uniref:Spermidine export protein MdtI n=1 Tax=Aliidiomarina taiwanensis TaxID=946228 RepID=A0A432X9G1_9GAMM|nr:SMR family transporter [Aliidiomarina taiwanensis]RUO43950.1 multidrug transporter subunit MdtI [Aliidiomarina taiwanensis]
MIYWLFISGSVVTDIAANVFLEKSQGFRRKRFGFLAIAFIMLAFGLLSFAVQGIPLFIAYAVWGALSISGTALATLVLFGHTLNWISCLGLGILILSIVTMQVVS